MVDWSWFKVLNNIVFVTIKDRVGLKASLMNIMLCHLRYDDDHHDDYSDDDNGNDDDDDDGYVIQSF